MELPILLLTPLPESAVKLVTQFLRKPHPCAMLIKQLKFSQSAWTSSAGKIFCYYLDVESEDRVFVFTFRRNGEPLGIEDSPFGHSDGEDGNDDNADDDDDDDDDYHVDCPGCSNCLGY